MAHVIQQTSLPAMTPQQMERLGHYFRAPRTTMPHTIGNASGVPYTTATAVALLLYTQEAGRLKWLVFHSCAEHQVAHRDYASGFQPLPFLCPECEQVVTNPDDLHYMLELQTTGSIEFK